MLVDARELPDRHLLRADVCVVGAGAAGITLARELARHGRRVALLESGGFDLESATQALYEGDGTMPSSGDAGPYLISSRLRFFGGSTNHWQGQCRPLDPIDFEERPWLPESGWPFGSSELEPYYRLAEPILGLRPFVTPSAAASTSRRKTLLPPSSGVETTRFHYSPPTRFGREFREEISSSPRIDLVLDANVLSFATDPQGRRVERAEVSTLEGRRLEVRAQRFVLAAGGIENPRLLLLSDGVDPRGLGNQHDLVGRCFMEHPHVRAAHVVLVDRNARLDPYLDYRNAQRSWLRCTDALQRWDQLPNCAFRLDPIEWLPALPLISEVSRLASDVERLRGGRRAGRRSSTRALTLLAMFEQAPDRENRVALGEETDALGLRKVRLTWRLSAFDLDGLRRSLDRLGRALGASGLGRLAPEEDAEELVSRAHGGNHHMGTTRMHADPRRGVVDADCRVHGLANLYVAGSSVFPTGGCSNPTLTLVALAFRLADHLAQLPAD